jgi:hypothetical protein
MDSEQLCRAMVHDLGNLLGGVQGILALDEAVGPDAQHRLRMALALEDGRQLLALARALGVGPAPESLLPWSAWRAGLEARLEPLAALHHGSLEILDSDAQGGLWPGPDFQDWAAACARSLLPWVCPGTLVLEARLEADAWVLRWPGEWPLPQALHPEDRVNLRLSLPGLWLRDRTTSLGITVGHGPEALEARRRRG